MADEVVVESTMRDLVVSLVDNNNAPINLTGGSARLQGKSAQIVTTVDVAGALTDPAQGGVTFTGIGALITAANLGSNERATFKLRVKYTDASAEWDYSDPFNIDWLAKPV